IREWWATAVMGNADWTAPRATGRRYLDGLEGVFSYAAELGLIEASPVLAFRQTLRGRHRTKRARAGADPTQPIPPIRTAAELARVVTSAEAESSAARVLVLLCLDGGLRLGEALGLRWGSIVWGMADHDRSRALRIDLTRPRGGALEPPKSGRARDVALSR